jgi:hypothetical protein
VIWRDNHRVSPFRMRYSTLTAFSALLDTTNSKTINASPPLSAIIWLLPFQESPHLTMHPSFQESPHLTMHPQSQEGQLLAKFKTTSAITTKLVSGGNPPLARLSDSRVWQSSPLISLLTRNVTKRLQVKVARVESKSHPREPARANTRKTPCGNYSKTLRARHLQKRRLLN